MPDFFNKIPDFYMIIARKIFFDFFLEGGGHMMYAPPVSYAYASNMLIVNFIIIVLVCLVGKCPRHVTSDVIMVTS